MSDAGHNSMLPSQLAAYADLFERLLDPTFILDLKSYEILEANPAAERVLGSELTELIGKPIQTFVEPTFQDAFSKDLRVAARRHHPRVFETQWKIVGEVDRILTMEVSACALTLTNQEEVFQLIVRDITFRREAEKKMQELLADLRVANEKLEALSTTDEMTKLWNFRSFKSQLAGEHSRADRAKSQYAIVFMDIDFFKKYNDRNGHPAGDALLTSLGEILKKSVRVNDFPARYGGEEFVVLCPMVDWRGAMVLAERLRKAVAETDFPFGDAQPDGRVTVSVGVSSFPDGGQTAEEVLHSADQAMYYSKTHGKNRVTSADTLCNNSKKSL